MGEGTAGAIGINASMSSFRVRVSLILTSLAFAFVEIGGEETGQKTIQGAKFSEMTGKSERKSVCKCGLTADTIVRVDEPEAAAETVHDTDTAAGLDTDTRVGGDSDTALPMTNSSDLHIPVEADIGASHVHDLAQKVAAAVVSEQGSLGPGTVPDPAYLINLAKVVARAVIQEQKKSDDGASQDAINDLDGAERANDINDNGSAMDGAIGVQDQESEELVTTAVGSSSTLGKKSTSRQRTSTKTKKTKTTKTTGKPAVQASDTNVGKGGKKGKKMAEEQPEATNSGRSKRNKKNTLDQWKEYDERYLN